MSILEISKADTEADTESNQQEPAIPSCIEKASLEKQKQLYKEQACQEETTARHRKDQHPGKERKKKQTETENQSADEAVADVIPIVQVPDDLIGKQAKHLVEMLMTVMMKQMNFLDLHSGLKELC